MDNLARKLPLLSLCLPFDHSNYFQCARNNLPAIQYAGCGEQRDFIFSMRKADGVSI